MSHICVNWKSVCINVGKLKSVIAKHNRCVLLFVTCLSGVHHGFKSWLTTASRTWSYTSRYYSQFQFYEVTLPINETVRIYLEFDAGPGGFNCGVRCSIFVFRFESDVDHML